MGFAAPSLLYCFCCVNGSYAGYEQLKGERKAEVTSAVHSQYGRLFFLSYPFVTQHSAWHDSKEWFSTEPRRELAMR